MSKEHLHDEKHLNHSGVKLLAYNIKSAYYNTNAKTNHWQREWIKEPVNTKAHQPMIIPREFKDLIKYLNRYVN